MANPTLLLALAATFLSLAVFSATALNHHKPAQALHSGHSAHSAAKKNKHAHHYWSTDVEDRPTEPYPGFYALVDRCLQNLSKKCGHEIFMGIFWVKAAVSDGCCVSLVEMGRRCHRKILKATIMVPELSKREKKEIKRRDAEIWSQCVLVRDALKYSPSPSAN